MAATVKMGVDVSGFKSGMQQAQQSAKMLQAQMKANEAQFKATGDKEKYVSEQSKLLKAQLDAQKTAAKNAEQAMKAMRDAGISETSAEYQRLATQLANAQAAMYSAQAAMNGLAQSETAAAGGAKNLNSSLSSIGKQISLENVTGAIDKIANGLEAAGKKAVELGKTIFDNMMASAAWADDAATSAEVYGVSLEKYLKVQKLVRNGMDTSAEAIFESQARMTYNVAKGDEAMKSLLRDMGLLQTQAGKYENTEIMPDAEELFWSAGRAIMNMTDEYEQAEYAQKLFGRSWRELRPLFNAYQSQDEFNAALDSTVTNTEEEVRALATLNDKMGELEGNLEDLANSVWASLAPALTDAAEALNGLLKSLLEYLHTEEGQEMMKGLGDAVSSLIGDLSKIDPEEVVGNFTGLFTKITDAFKWIKDNKDTVIAAIKGIGIAFGTIKIVSLASNVTRLVEGFKGFGGGGTGTGTGTGTGFGTGGGNLLNGQTVTSQNVTTQSITNATITNETITNATITNETVTNQTVTNGNVTNATFTKAEIASLTVPTESITTSNVTTMYVQTMIGGNGTNPGTGGNGGNGISGGNGTGFNMFLPGNNGTGSNLYNGYGNGLESGSNVNLQSGNNGYLPSGQSVSQPSANEPIRVDPDAYNNVSDTPVQTPQTQPEIQPKTQPDQGGRGGLNMQWLWSLVPLGVFALGTAPAIIKDYKLAELYQGRYEETKKFAESAAAAGANAEDIQMLMRLARTATGMKEDPNSSTGYKMSYMNYIYDISETDENDWILQALGDPRVRGLLYSDIQKYGPRDAFGDLNTGIGWSPWQLLLRYWGNYTETDWDKNGNPYERRADNPLDAQEINALLEYLRQMYINKIQAQIDKNEAEKALNIEVEPELAEGFQEQLQGMLNAMTLTVSVFPAIGKAGIRGGIGGILGAMLGGGEHANGLWNVPWDGYPAILHRGERVLTASENQRYTYNNYFGTVNLNNGLEIDALTESIERRNQRQRSGYGAM